MRSIEWSPSEFGLARLREGQLAMSRARLATFRDDPDAELLARNALSVLRAAVDGLDDLPEQFDAHYELDRAGRWVRETFGCSLEQDGRGYWRSCPVDLGHQRWGMSPGMTNVERICMVCGQDTRLCRHIAGRIYEAATQRIHGYCNVCGSQEECDDTPGELAEVVCSRLITKADIGEISLVRRPAQTAARIMREGVGIEELERTLGPDGWRPGMTVSCDICLQPCGGLREIREPEIDLALDASPAA